jgi:uncharacterized protein YjdB
MKFTRIKTALITFIAALSVSVGVVAVACAPDKTDDNNVKSVSLNRNSATLDIGDELALQVTVLPAKANQQVKWSSSNPAAAEVSNTGKVTAKSAGKATITVVSAENSAITDKCEVTVQEATPVEPTFKLVPSQCEIAIGVEQALTVVWTPENAEKQEIKWESGDDKIATVSASGVVKGVGKGEVKITATSADNKISAYCDVKVITEGVMIEDIIISSTNPQYMTVGYKTTIVPIITPQNATNKTLYWESSNTDVLSVNQNGYIEALKAGEATLSAAATDGSNVKAECLFIVETASIPLSRIVVPENIEVDESATKQITVTLVPENTTERELTWESKNSDIATVDNNGLVTGISKGYATIIVSSAQDPNKQALCYVKVLRRATGIAINPESLEIVQDQSYAINAYPLPIDASNMNVSWSTSNKAIATLDDNIVTGIAPGEAIITATTEDGGFQATCNVTVLPVAISSISLNKHTLSLPNGTTEQLFVTINPPEAPKQDLMWSSNNNNIATVSNDGVVTAIAPGTTTITVITADGKHSDRCTVTVTAVAVTGISLSARELELQVQGASLPLHAYLSPSNATNINISWVSNNPSVISVIPITHIPPDYYDILVTAVEASGSAIITATTEDGGYTASCYVTIRTYNVPVTGVRTIPDANSYVGGQVDRAAGDYILPANASNKNATWSIDDTSIVDFAEGSSATDRLVTFEAKKVGVATITMTTEEGGYTASFKYTVTPWPGTK